MVLRITALPALVAVALAAACITPPAPRRLAQPSAITVAYLHQRQTSGWSTAIPDGFVSAQTGVLAARNLDSQPFAAGELAAAALTQARLAALAASATTPVVALIETSSRFDSQLSGRFRWTVYAKLTVADRADLGRSVSEAFDVPVLLDYEHQRDDAALLDAAAPVAQRLGRVVDAFLTSYGAEGQKPTAASATPAAIYLVMIDRFANGDPRNDVEVDAGDPAAWHGGDLAGLTARLDYIKDLGFDTVWITPHYQTRTAKFGGHGAFHGYWTSDLAAVEPRFGSDADLDALVRGVEARGMNLMIDLVLNHVGPETALVTRRPDWFHQDPSITDWHDPIQAVRGQVHGLPDLDQDKPEVYRYLFGASERWLQQARPAAIRFDAVRHIAPGFWKKFLPQLRERAKRRPLFIGEIFDGDPAAIRDGFGLGFDMLYDFPLYYGTIEALCGDKPLAQAAAALSVDRTYPDPRRLVTFIDNHDLPRAASRCRDRAGLERLLLFVLTIRGTPALTYGTELGLTGGDEPANRGDMRWDQRDQVLAERIRALLAARRSHPSVGGAHHFLVAEDDLLVWRQSGASGDDALIAISTAAEPRQVKLPSDVVPRPAPELGAGLSSCGAGCLAIAAGASGVAWIPRLGVTSDSREVHFRAAGQPAGGQLMLIGSAPELGGWKREAALAANGQAPSEFTVRLRRGEVVAYKLARRSAAGFDYEGGDNRFLLVDDTVTGPIELAWRK